MQFWGPIQKLESECLEGESQKFKKSPYVEMQINTTIRYHYIPNRTAKIIFLNDKIQFWWGHGEAFLEVERYK